MMTSALRLAAMVTACAVSASCTTGEATSGGAASRADSELHHIVFAPGQMVRTAYPIVITSTFMAGGVSYRSYIVLMPDPTVPGQIAEGTLERYRDGVSFALDTGVAYFTSEPDAARAKAKALETRPVVETPRVIIASDGTTYIVRIRKSESPDADYVYVLDAGVHVTVTERKNDDPKESKWVTPADYQKYVRYRDALFSADDLSDLLDIGPPSGAHYKFTESVKEIAEEAIRKVKKE
jgi:hypothetical protein